MSFGESLFTGDRVCIRRKTILKQRETQILEQSMQARELEGSHSEAIQPKRPRNAGAWIQGPINRRKLPTYRQPPRTHLRTHLAVSQMKGGARGNIQGSAKPEP